MGTNYYVRLNICPTCKRPEEEIHLGKSSAGWKFHLRANDYQYYKSWDEMKNWLKDKSIFNEYGEEKTCDYFIKLVESKQLAEEESEDCINVMHGKIIDGYVFYNREFS